MPHQGLSHRLQILKSVMTTTIMIRPAKLSTAKWFSLPTEINQNFSALSTSKWIQWWQPRRDEWLTARWFRLLWQRGCCQPSHKKEPMYVLKSTKRQRHFGIWSRRSWLLGLWWTTHCTTMGNKPIQQRKFLTTNAWKRHVISEAVTGPSGLLLRFHCRTVLGNFVDFPDLYWALKTRPVNIRSLQTVSRILLK